MWVIKAIVLFRKICIGLRGLRENLKRSGNCSNFLAISKRSSGANNLKTHLNSPSPRNSKYMSRHIQNENTNTISYGMLQNGLSEEGREVMFLSIIANKVQALRDRYFITANWIA